MMQGSDVETASQYAVGGSGTHSPAHHAAEPVPISMEDLNERLEDLEVKVKASLEIQSSISDVVASTLEKIDILGSQMLTQEGLDKALKPLQKNLEEVRAILNTMKATPIMSAAPKQTQDKGKGVEQDSKPRSAKPAPEDAPPKKPVRSVKDIARGIREQAARNKTLD